MDILRILDDLSKLAVEQPKSWLGVTFGYQREEIAMSIHKVRANLPSDLKTAAQTVKESDRILENARDESTVRLEQARKEAEKIVQDAKDEAARILERARLQQETMLNENEILRISKAQSEEVRNAAEREANQLRKSADQYSYDVLARLESAVGKVLDSIERGKNELAPKEVPSAVVQVREKAKV